MRSTTVAGYDLQGNPVLAEFKVEDYVRPDHLDAYVADARTKWQFVDVSAEPDAGPLGYHGPTAVPAHLPLPDAGVVYPATPGSDAERALAAAEPRPDDTVPSVGGVPSEQLQAAFAAHLDQQGA